MASLSLKNVTKKYPNGFVAVKDFNLEIADKEFIIFVGPSGCGKSTTLRMIAGLEDISSGELYIDGKLVNDVEPKDRDIAMVFQNYALYPHMSVYDNMAFGLKLRKTPKDEIDKKVHDAAKILDLEHLLDRKPKALSGGQRQRIGIARALAVEPKFLVLDEPISALDVSIQAQIVNLLIKLQKEMDLTYLFVAHDLSMVKHISDRVAVMYLGSMVEITSSEELYKNPLHPYTQALLSAIPIPDPEVEIAREKTRIKLEGDVPSPVNPAPGCRFKGRCKYAKEICSQCMPTLKDIGNGHQVACHLYDEK